jgi:hypothetical protein
MVSGIGILRYLNFLFILLLVACGGATVSSQNLEVKIKDCANYEYKISGNFVYLIVDETCNLRDVETQFFFNGEEVAAVLSVFEEKEVFFSNQNFRVTIFKENSWRNIPNIGSWSPRDGAGPIVLNGKVYLLGGWNHETIVNEVWATNDLKTWNRLPDAPWQPRHGAGWVVHKNRMYVVGGDLIDDVWASSDGITWTLVVSQAPFGQRYTPIVHSNGEYIYLYGGQYWTPVWWCSNRPDCLPAAPRDVWRSKDGANWEKVLAEAPWEGRALIHGSLFFGGEIFLVGGGLKNATGRYSETYSEFTDIWSSIDGVKWDKRSDSMGFLARTHFSVLSTSYGCYVSDGSVITQVNVSNDIFFAEDCINFKKLIVPIDLPARHASSLFEFNGSIVLLGGPPPGGSGTAIWQYFPKLRN